LDKQSDECSQLEAQVTSLTDQIEEKEAQAQEFATKIAQLEEASSTTASRHETVV